MKSFFYFPVQEDLLVLVLLLSYEAGLANRVLIGLRTEAWQLPLVSARLHLAVRLTIEDVLRPGVILLEARDDIAVHEVLHARWIHELAELHAVVLKLADLRFTEVECPNDLVILKLK